MVTIKCTENEKGMLLRILDNYRQYRIIECSKNKITDKELQYDTEIMNRLIDRINGKFCEDYLKNSKVYREKTGKARFESETI